MSDATVLPPPASAPPTARAELDRAVNDLSERGEAWLATGVEERIAYLHGLSDRTMSLAAEQVAAQVKAKGLVAGTPREACTGTARTPLEEITGTTTPETTYSPARTRTSPAPTATGTHPTTR